MHVLVTEQNPGQSAELALKLRYLGCVVSTCHNSSTDVCKGVVAGGCPLEGRGPTAMVVAVRDERELTAREFGAVCGVRAGVPVVLTGPGWHDKPPVPDGLRHRVSSIRSGALLTGCVDALHDEKSLNGRDDR
ncbi:hypothetical protein [Kutzneria buriramensis]|uniref:Uncharacterized protein n=1 Tax=Kutzneria buriramensis TaxID=1045776 RepID=A0A3E0GZM3_9PSEU|nr:hypothetical protein [Kutzneria buriramensis]REH34804.1 hypothetical protein BCF44_11980 [Kutzneria buriramensis]